MKAVQIVSIDDAFEIQDGSGNYLADSEDMLYAIAIASEIARRNELDHIRIKLDAD